MSFIPSQDIIGKAFAIAGLALAAPASYYFRMPSRILDYVQLVFIFASTYASGTTLFSGYLDYSWLSFMPSFLDKYCTTGDYICTYGYLLSPAIAWLGAAFFMLILLKLIGLKKENVGFRPFYLFWKGFLRWFMCPLVYYSTNILVKKLQAKTIDKDFIASAGVLGFFVLFTWIELIGLKCAQKESENIWKKWMEYFSHLRIMFIAALIVIGSLVDPLAKYFIYGPLCLYFLLYSFKYVFTFKVCERVFFLLGEAVLITLFSIFLFKPSYVSTYSLDLFGLAIVILLEILLFLPKLVSRCKAKSEDEDGSVAPEKNEDDRPIKPARGNSYGQSSFEELNSSVTSPRRDRETKNEGKNETKNVRRR